MQQHLDHWIQIQSEIHFKLSTQRHAINTSVIQRNYTPFHVKSDDSIRRIDSHFKLPIQINSH